MYCINITVWDPICFSKNLNFLAELWVTIAATLIVRLYCLAILDIKILPFSNLSIIRIIGPHFKRPCNSWVWCLWFLIFMKVWYAWTSKVMIFNINFLNWLLSTWIIPSSIGLPRCTWLAQFFPRIYYLILLWFLMLLFFFFFLMLFFWSFIFDLDLICLNDINRIFFYISDLVLITYD